MRGSLTPATAANGCMQFVKGSHSEGRFAHRDTHAPNPLLHRGQLIDERFNESRVAFAELEPGEASLHHGWVVHSSRPNASDAQRTALSVQFVRPGIRQTVITDETTTLVRVREDYRHFAEEPPFVGDFEPSAVAFQQRVERLKRDVYDNA